MDVDNDVFFSKRTFNRLFEGLSTLNLRLSRLVYWHIQVDWEFHAICFKCRFRFRKLFFGLFFVVKTILTIVKICIFPLVSISHQLRFNHLTEGLAICLNECRWDVQVTDQFACSIFTICLGSIGFTVKGKADGLTEVFVQKSFLSR